MKKKLMLNTVTSLLLRVVTVVCGFILPRLILGHFGSSINGLVQSITQFLGVISFLELGVGQIIQSALYKPLAKKDNDELSKILSSGEKFFKRIAYLLLGYVFILSLVYPKFIDNTFDYMFTIGLIVVICIGSFAQYYFGIIDSLLLNADQKGYIQYISQIITIILNTIISSVLINCGCSIHVVKLSASLIFLIRPFLIRMYIKRNYSINRKIKYTEEPIKQKWYGIAQHISAFILNGTDNIVLTIFSTLENVSVYTVYHMIIYGVHQIYISATAGVHSLVGELWAKQQLEKLNNVYSFIEMILHFSTVFLFSCTWILLIPFINVYTNNVADINYIYPLFGGLLVIAHASQCFKTTYNIMILAGGHYKQTQKCHVISALLNLIISIFSVRKFGLIGVALGTCISMIYQMTWMAWYNSKNYICWPFTNFVKQILLDVLTAYIIILSTSWITLQANTYLAWVVMAFKVAIIASIIVVLVAYCAYPDKMKKIFLMIKNKINKKTRCEVMINE